MAVTSRQLVKNAVAMRDAALAEYREVRDNPDAYDGCDPGDARVTIEGNRYNVLDVLRFCELIGLGGCDPNATNGD